MRFRDKLIRFMYGRYGYDKLSFFMFVMYFVLFFVRIILAFFSTKAAGIASLVILFLSTMLLVIITFRFFSRNISARRKENDLYLKLSRPVKDFFKRSFNRIRYVKKYRYRKCPHCKSFLRLPNKKGKHNVCCPRCKKDFDVNIII